MVTFTMLAESKCEDPLSEQVMPAPGSSTHTATVEERPRRAAWISRAIAAATAGCDFELQATAAAAGLAPAAAGTSTAMNDPSSTTTAVASGPGRDFPLASGARMSRFSPPDGQ